MNQPICLYMPYINSRYTLRFDAFFVAFPKSQIISFTILHLLRIHLSLGVRFGDFMLRHTNNVNKQNRSAVILGRHDKFQLGNSRDFFMPIPLLLNHIWTRKIWGKIKKKLVTKVPDREKKEAICELFTASIEICRLFFFVYEE